MMWTVEGKIESLDGTYGGDGAHVGIDDLSRLLAEHVDRWAKIRVELIEGPRPLPYVSRNGKLIDYEPSPRPTEDTTVEQPKRNVAEDLKRMRALAKRVRKHIAIGSCGTRPGRHRRREDFDRRLQSIESRGVK